MCHLLVVTDSATKERYSGKAESRNIQPTARKHPETRLQHLFRLLLPAQKQSKKMCVSSLNLVQTLGGRSILVFWRLRSFLHQGQQDKFICRPVTPKFPWQRKTQTSDRKRHLADDVHFQIRVFVCHCVEGEPIQAKFHLTSQIALLQALQN